MSSASDSTLIKFVLAGCSNMSAACVTNPIDVIKVRMQLEGQLSRTASLVERNYPGFFRGGQYIITTEGVNGLYKGLTASLLREGSYSTIRFGLYDTMKELVGGTTDTSLGKKILAGGMTGAIGSAIATPTDLVKIRMQGATSIRYDSAWSGFKDIYTHEGGIKALWRGISATTQRAALLTATQIPTYDHTKHYLLNHGYFKEGMPLHMLCSMIAGFMTATVTSPVDVIKTRIMNENMKRTGDAPVYSSTLGSLIKIIKSEGIIGLYKGWVPNWMRIGPHTIVSLLIFEQLRALAGIKPV